MDINQPVQNQQNQEPAASDKHSCCDGPFKGNKISTIMGAVILVAVASVVAAFVLLKSAVDRPQASSEVTAPKKSAPQPNRQTQTSAPQTEDDTTAAISAQLDNVMVTDLDSEFKDIDADLNSL